jgi:hypothetical protein
LNLRTPTHLNGILALLLLAAGPACGTRSKEPVQPLQTTGPAANAPAVTTGPAANAPAATAAPPAAPAQPPPPVPVEIPAGTRLKVTLARGLATDKDRTGDPWEGTLAAAVMVDGKEVWPRGTPVRGVIAQSEPAGRLKGSGGLGIRVSTVGRNGVKTGTYRVAGAKRGGRDAKIIGGTAAVGALVGILTGRGHQADHALGGAAIGAAAGTGLAAGTADTVIRIPAGRPLAFSLTAPGQVLKQP